MKHPISLGLASIMVIGSSSQALLSNSRAANMDSPGFHCTRLQQYQQITITLSEHEVYTQSCGVRIEGSSRSRQQLWHNQRSYWNCQQQAQSIAQRLADRGWQCQSAGL